MKNLLFLAAVLLAVNTYAQLPDGSTAPDFTLTDYYGNTHNLYAYLDDEKTVFIKIFAAHCPSCWAYHQSNKLQNTYNNYGPDGTDEVMVLALEYDQYNDSNAFNGNHEPWVTQGNWLENTPYPIFNVEDPDRGVFEDYNVTGYPVIYRVCPDRILERVSTSETEAQLYERVQEECQTITASLSENTIDLGNIYIDQIERSLRIERYEDIQNIQVVNLQGQVVKTINAVNHSIVPLNELNRGVYLFELLTSEGPVVKKLFLN